MSNNPWDVPQPESNDPEPRSGSGDFFGEDVFDSTPANTGSFAGRPTSAGAQGPLNGAPMPAWNGAAPAPEKKRSINGPVVALVILVVLAIVGGGAVFFLGGAGKNLAAMSYISTDDPGPNPFMESAVNAEVAAGSIHSNLVSASAQGAVAGDDPNIYGGSGELSVCDADALVANLAANADLNAAFAEGIGINAHDVERYVHSLTPVILRQDTWVTNHGHDNGRATPYQSVLQRGTAVMVDAYGVPRVRCSCGNPLAEAWNGYTAPEVDKANWDGYEPRDVVTIYETDVAIDTINVIDIDDGTTLDIGIDHDDSATQQEVLDAVTDDTPVTTPEDMGVRPDGKLLGEMGLAEADGDASERPTGADRFSDYQQWAETGWGGVGDGSDADAASGDADWKSQTTAVDPEEFRTDSTPDYLGDHYVQFSNRDVGCLIHPENQAIYCFVQDFLDSGREGRWMSIDPQYPNAPDGNGPLNFLIAGGPRERFIPVALMLESPLIGLEPSKLLEPGESVTVGGITCFNLGDTIGCDAVASGFVMDDNDDVYVDRSEIAVLDQ